MKKTLLHSSVVGAMSLVLGLASASGAIITSISAAPPSAEQSLIRAAVPEGTEGNAYMMRYYNNYSSGANRHREIGQSFIVPGTDPVAIDGFVLRIDDNRDFSSITVAKNFTFSIYKAASNGIPEGDAIYVSTGLLPETLTNRHYITFQLDETVVLEDGGRYCFQIGYTTSSGASQLSFAASGDDIYTEGRSFYYSNSNSSDPASMIYTSAQRDIDFAVLYTPVPEGKTAGLMIMSIAALGIYRGIGNRLTGRAK